MGYASKSGRARTTAKSPSAFGVCDRCSMWYNLKDLQWQMDWRGNSLQNIRLLVCNRCTDVPQEQLRTIRLPADPLPIPNARIENYAADETANGPAGGPVGPPLGLEQGAVMPFQYVNGATVAYGVQLNALSVVGSGTTVTVTLSSPYTFIGTYPQISVLGLTNAAATGFFNATPVSPMVFTYQLTNGSATGSLLGPHTNIITCNVGLPLGVTDVGQITGSTAYLETESGLILETEGGVNIVI